MRLRFLSLISLMLLLLMPQGGAQAASVLLPDDSKSPNLGLVPSEPATTDKAQPAASADSDKEKSKTSSSATLPSLSSTPLPYTPIPQTPAVANGVIAMPTTVIKEPDAAAMQQPPAMPPNLSPQDAKAFAEATAHMNAPYRLTVGLTTKSIFGPRDIDEVYNHLGIDKSKVPSMCHLSVGGLLLTDKGPYMFESGLSPRTDAHFDGAITNAMIHVLALCDMVPLPPNKGIVIQMGDKYTVPLGGVTCPAPASGSSFKQLAVFYPGNGGGECKYQ